MPPEETTERMSLGERELVARAKEDPSAFGALYDAYVDKIYNYVYHRVGNHHDSEDLTSRTFYRALNNIHRYTDRGLPFSAWLYRIAHNLVANWHRDQGRHPVVSLDVAPLDDLPDSPEAVAVDNEERERLLNVVRRLPADRQELLVLKFAGRMSNAEILDGADRRGRGTDQDHGASAVCEQASAAGGAVRLRHAAAAGGH